MMVVDKIKDIMEKLNINQCALAVELSRSTDKYYSQSMISKRLKSDNNITLAEFIEIYRILDRYQRKVNKKRLKIDIF